MNFTQLEKIAPALLSSGKSFELFSSPGRGKSEFINSLPPMMSRLTGDKWGFASCFIATQTPTDMMGFMVPERIKDRLMSSFTMPTWMQTIDPVTGLPDGGCALDYEYGVLHLEEFGQGEADTKRSSSELLLNKRLGQWGLGRGWCVWASSNYASDRSGVTKSFDYLINRRGEIKINDDLASWERWALSHGVSPILITFAKQNPNIVFSEGVPEKQGPWCTPRSLVACEKVLMKMADADGKIPTSPEANEIASGMIGVGGASQLFAMIQLSHVMPAYEDIVKDPKGTQVPTRPDAQMLVCYSLAARVTDKVMKPIVTYIERFPKEFAVTFAKSAARRDPDLIDTEAFSEWCVKNQTLMGTIARATL